MVSLYSIPIFTARNIPVDTPGSIERDDDEPEQCGAVFICGWGDIRNDQDLVLILVHERIE